MLLDENLPSKLTGLFAPEVEAVTVAQQGWRGKDNGELLALARREFDALATMDRGIPYQQNLEDLDLVILLFEAPSNRLVDLAPLVDEAKAALSEARPGDVVPRTGVMTGSLWRSLISIPLRAGLDHGDLRLRQPVVPVDDPVYEFVSLLDSLAELLRLPLRFPLRGLPNQKEFSLLN